MRKLVLADPIAISASDVLRQTALENEIRRFLSVTVVPKVNT